jgi:hypothetical protein
MISNNLPRTIGHQARHVSGVGSQSIVLNDTEAKVVLGKFFNLDLLQKVVAKGRISLQPRAERTPVPEAGLLAIAAYTSAGLDRMIYQTYFSGGGPADRHDAAKALEALILETLPKIALTQVSVVKRNLTLNPTDVRLLYRPGSLVRFDRITSVTLQPHQVYRGGNVDLTIKPRLGVIDVSSLSTFSGSHDRAEKEGMLDPGAIYEVTRMEGGRENSPLDPENRHKSLHPENWTIALQELRPS